MYAALTPSATVLTTAHSKFSINITDTLARNCKSQLGAQLEVGLLRLNDQPYRAKGDLQAVAAQSTSYIKYLVYNEFVAAPHKKRKNMMHATTAAAVDVPYDVNADWSAKAWDQGFSCCGSSAVR